MGWKAVQAKLASRGLYEERPVIVDRVTGNRFRVMADVEVVVDGDGKPLVDSRGEVRVKSVLTGEET